MRKSELSIALISDSLTAACLSKECRILALTPLNYKWVLRLQKPDLLFVESAWEGHRRRWQYKVASYPGHRDHNNKKLLKVVSYARDCGIPTVFWNKEDGVHFDRFIESARLFDHIFTVDDNCIDKYKLIVGEKATVDRLMFPVQTETHFFRGFDFKFHHANFVGSYSRKIHESRRNWQDLLFSACADAGVKTVVYDRNSGRNSPNYRYPDFDGLEVRAAIPHSDTAHVYRDYLISLNVNTIEDSPSMYSRRLVEILACGGIAVTNPTTAVDRYFSDYCHVIRDRAEATDLFARLKKGPSAHDLERAEAGARYVLTEHTWSQRLNDVRKVVGL
ncbi:CgeB family protein [Sinorhizobium fredii]|uniref:CgeB family protein n=1 Tax=Rhizobium fredii TaxID=380 RepID=UPI000568ABAA|nr:glycosyltransferase [Sinorhizobium fredii]MQW97563.1 glycosyltransferase [Sinorhizobium fredii]